MASSEATQLPFSAPSLFSKTDERISRISKVLATSSGVDSTLTLVGYGLFFISSQIRHLENLELKSLSHSRAAAPTLIRSIVKLAELEASAKTLASMCSDFRTFTRLWGLLGVYAMAKRNYVDPPEDVVLRAVSYGQTLSLAAYYVHENGYYLAGKGVLRGWTPEKIRRWAKTSLRMFLAYVVLEFVRLYRARQLREVREVKAVDEEDRVEIEREERVWWRSAVLNVAYTPLGLHWASESGLLSDGVVGALMSGVGLIKFRAAWAQTA